MSRVLITKNITTNQLRLIMEAELQFEIQTAVEFEISFKTNEVIQKIKRKSDWLFTSINGVKSILPLLTKYQNKFEQKIYCVGKNTLKLLSELGYYSVRMYESAEDMKNSFSWHEAHKLTYFCNNSQKTNKINKRIMPNNVFNGPINLEFVEVFKANMLKPNIQNYDFDYVLYFSPLGATSILSQNPALSKVKSICQGPATHKILSSYGVENSIIIESPNLKSIVDFIINDAK